MLLDTQDTPRAQGHEGIGKGFFGNTCGHPGVYLAHEQHHVSRARRRDGASGRAKLTELDRAIELAICLQHIAQGPVQGQLGRVGIITFRETNQMKGATAPGQVGSQDLGVPAATGPELDHSHLRLQPQEPQGLDRMAPGVAPLVLRRAPRPRNGPFQRALGRAVRLRHSRFRRDRFFLLAAAG